MIRCVIWLAAAGLACGSERRSEAAHAGIPDRAPPSTSTVDPDSTELRFTSVSAGEEFTCGLAQEGRAYCWGSNEVGQLGDGSKMGELVNRPYAAPVAGGHAFAAISAGDVHVCALTADGQAFCWGYDVNGALGGPGKRSAVPSAVVTDLRFVAVVAGPQRTCGLTRDGVVYCWGRFSLPSAAPGGRPALEPTRLPGEIQFRAVGLGLSHACGLARDSRVYCWGSNEFGELGVRPTGPRRPAPVPVTFPEGAAESFTSVGASPYDSCAVDEAGRGYCWGRDMFGQLGNGRLTSPDEPTPTPTLVAGGHQWRLIRPGDYACGLVVQGEAYCWGLTSLPQTPGTSTAANLCDGPPPRTCSTEPLPVAGGLRFRDLSVGGGHSCGVTTDGGIYCWGRNDYGQLGNGSREPSAEPTRVLLRLEGAPVRSPP